MQASRPPPFSRRRYLAPPVLPVSFVIKSTDDFSQLYPVSQALLAAALKSGKFIFLQSDLKLDQPQANSSSTAQRPPSLG